MSDNPLTCQLSGCEGSPAILDKAGARKHRHRYHSVPVPFKLMGRQYIVTHSNNCYTCPLPACGKPFKQRDSIEHHIINDHDVDRGTTLFRTASTGLQTAQGARNALVQVLVPATPCPQGVDSAVTTSAADSVTVLLMPSTDYLKSNEVLDALGVCMHMALKILICYSCGVALTSEMVAGHRKNHHPSYKARSSLPVVLRS
ncbi:hypothetical protein EDB19DRAFT_1920484 [Suillus lakei]|nr:hypothetical protein EDB19DRAFT_1920484 [Suillus lakei]